ncbi:uncharacterized protein N7477_009588 [Penicillium maclennaniae]|uniref:uncharacterized protein n=1 Tax=Penicillium maclennaniae TaxID=1343394 RepID=UPI00253FA2D1|nr:uncharacterized protein N7477_009588 [Penicillium maclennaniae]KAJ5661972.1 hypothetical protein N7477_009588 [Penicillium maclennaniae]
MPVCNLFLLQLAKSTDAHSFLQQLKQTPNLQVIVASRPRHVVIHPNILDNEILTKTPWDLLVLLQSSNPTPFSHLSQHITKTYKLPTGIPSKLLSDYSTRSESLKSQASSVPLTGSLDKILHSGSKSTSQNLEVSPSLLEFMTRLEKTHKGPVTMLNLLHFHHPDGKKSYYQYGQAFIPVAGKRGGNAKLVGNVVPAPAGHEDHSRGDRKKTEEWWNEISIVHYPSIRHFCDMLAGEDYQAINEKYRLSALHDTFLLCTTEFDVEGHENSKL